MLACSLNINCMQLFQYFFAASIADSYILKNRSFCQRLITQYTVLPQQEGCYCWEPTPFSTSTRAPRHSGYLSTPYPTSPPTSPSVIRPATWRSPWTALTLPSSLPNSWSSLSKEEKCELLTYWSL